MFLRSRFGGVQLQESVYVTWTLSRTDVAEWLNMSSPEAVARWIHAPVSSSWRFGTGTLLSDPDHSLDLDFMGNVSDSLVFESSAESLTQSLQLMNLRVFTGDVLEVVATWDRLDGAAESLASVVVPVLPSNLILGIRSTQRTVRHCQPGWWSRGRARVGSVVCCDAGVALRL